MYCVVGSGPTGVACASALLERGARVHLVDPGVRLESERHDRVQRMAATPPEGWTAAELAWIQAGTESGAGGIPLKLLYGSDFPYREADERLSLRREEVGLHATLAQGGFSNVWGAALLPYSDLDLAGWPFDSTALTQHYAAVVRLTGLAGRQDELTRVFPLHTDRPTPLPLSRQAERFLSRLEAHGPELERSGWLFGQSRLALGGAPAVEPGCVQCGLCMFGCPYGLIYNSTTSLDTLRAHPNFSYQTDFILDRFEPGSGGLQLHGRDRVSGSACSLPAERVFLAAGVIPTTQIVLRSLGRFNQPVVMRDSQYFLVPLLSFSGTGRVRDERLHTLCQLFLELLDPAISAHRIHLQVYTYNSLIGQVLRRALGPLAGAFEGRMLVLQGYLHSEHSSTLEVELHPAGAGDTLRVTGRPSAEARRMIGRIVRKLAAQAVQFGALPLAPAVKVAEPGRGFHSGGTLPMRQHPGDLETDLLGRLPGFERVHLVDSSVMPTIAAPTITFTAMANAHRIGWEAAAL